jgi:hypothetical protein
MKTRKYTKPVIIGSLLAGALMLTAGSCGGPSDAEMANKNMSTAADNFEINRHIVGVNGITDKYAFEVVGRCSINDQGNQLEVTCKDGPNSYKKHMIGLSDNVFYVATQLDSADVSVYHTRVIIKPETLIPEAELSMGKQ